MQQEFLSGKYQIRLDDGSVVAHSDAHCIKPYLFGDWLFYAETRDINNIVAKNLVNGQERRFAFGNFCMNYEPPMFDGRYVCFVGIVRQGKSSFPNTAWALVFDTVGGNAVTPARPLTLLGVGPSPYFWHVWVASGYEAAAVNTTVASGFTITVTLALFSSTNYVAVKYQRQTFTLVPSPASISAPVIEESTEVPPWL